MRRWKSKQNAQKRGVPTPKAAEIASKKAAFLAALRAASGNVSAALQRSGLNRRTAYKHFETDPEFAAAWSDVLEIAADEVIAEMRRRAFGYKRGPNGERVRTHERASDRLLIHLMERHTKQHKWRGRIIDTGVIALNVVAKEGAKQGLSAEQINRIRDAMIKGFHGVSLS